MLEQIVKKAKEEEQLLAKKRSSLRYRKILGRLVAMNLLRTTGDILLNRDKMKIGDLLWAGEIDPRIFELIPAIAIKKPGAIADIENAPKDLKIVLNEIRSANPVTDFRYARPKDYMQWLGSVGQRQKTPTKLKSFRFQQADLELLQLFKREGMTEIEAVRKGLLLLSRNY